MKSKNVAGTLALLMGIFGVHRFYLGKRFLGIMHLILFFIAFVITVEENAPFILIPMVVALIDAILLFVMPQEEFDEKYNSRAFYRGAHQLYSRPVHHQRNDTEYYDRSYQQRPAPEYSTGNNRFTAKRSGIERFRQHDFHGAIDAFEYALEDNYEDPALHFNLACCYSRIEREDAAFFHLEKAVEFGFNNLDKIHNHDALAFLRSLPEFRDFVRNGYTQAEPLPALNDQKLLEAETEPEKNDLLDQIIKLGNLRDKGILTEQEFAKQKKKLLGES